MLNKVDGRLDVAPDMTEFLQARHLSVVSAAEEAGLLEGGNRNVGARMPDRLIQTAKARSGLNSTTELLEYALAKVALEDDFGAKLVARKGRIPRNLDL